MQFAAPAEQYDRFMGRYAPSLAAALIDAAEVTSGQRVCDVGCGPGGLTRELVARVGAANVAAIDPAPQFAAACRERNPGADVREGMAEQLPWATGEFDSTLSSLVIGFMRDPDLGVREMVRVTHPGGAVAACMWDIANGGMTMLRLFWSAARQVDPGVEGESAMAGTTRGDIAERSVVQAWSTWPRGNSRPTRTTAVSTTSGRPSRTRWGPPASTCSPCHLCSRKECGRPAGRSFRPLDRSRSTHGPGMREVRSLLLSARDHLNAPSMSSRPFGSHDSDRRTLEENSMADS